LGFAHGTVIVGALFLRTPTKPIGKPDRYFSEFVDRIAGIVKQLMDIKNFLHPV
jgi:hypothetical protein